MVLVGGVMYVSGHAGEAANYRVFMARPTECGIGRAAGWGCAGRCVGRDSELGILLLVATPICRVIFAVIGFCMERDRLYVAISLVVLAVLLFGMLRAG